MRPIVGLDGLLARATDKGVFGTKMRSVIKLANDSGVKSVVQQQFDVARQILAADLVPIIEPEVDIRSPEKAEAEVVLEAALHDELGQLASGQYVMLKLTPRELDDFYADLVSHPNILRVVALSGGYSGGGQRPPRPQPRCVVASFSRALTERLSIEQSDDEFNSALNESIESIFDASVT